MATYHNRLIIGFARSSPSRMVIYLKQCEESREWAVKTLVNDVRTVVKTSYSLSEALRELAETVAQYTDGLTSWRAL